MSWLLERFAAASSVESAGTPDELLPNALARACTQVLPFDAAGLSLMSSPTARVPLGASDDTALEAERLQFSFGDGPCFHAMREGRPVVVSEESFARTWPLLAEQHFARTPYRAGLSVPLRHGPARIGVLDLYLERPRGVDGHDVVAGQVIAEAITTALLDAVATGGPPGAEPDAHPGEGAAAAWLENPAARRRSQVWVAVGLATQELRLSGEESLAVLRGYAYSAERTLDDVAGDLVTGRLDIGVLRLAPASQPPEVR